MDKNLQLEEEQAKLEEIYRLKAALRGVEEETLLKRQEEQKAAKERAEARKREAQEQLEAQRREEVRLKMEADAEINRRQREIDEKLQQVKEQERQRIELESLAEKAEQELRASEVRRKAAELLAQAEAERVKNIAENQEIKRRALQEERDLVEARLYKERQETLKRLAVEQQLNEAEETTRIGKLKAQQLENARNQAKFLEEQNRKTLEDTLKVLQTRIEAADTTFSTVNMEYPQAQTEGDKAVSGTEGNTQDENMSPHLRNILRQINR